MYALLKFLMRLYTYIYFRKIYVKGWDQIDKKQGYFLAINHQNAFLDAIVISVVQPRPVYFLTRGDFFKSKLSNKLFRGLKMIPIFRQQDGFKDIRKNDQTFAECQQKIREGGLIAIFPEGSHDHKMHLRPLKKGLPRMIAQMYFDETEQTDVQIIPVGIQFYKHTSSRSDLHISFGEPMSTLPIWNEKTSDNHFYTKVNKQLHEAMRELIFHVPLENYDALTSQWSKNKSQAKKLAIRYEEDKLQIEGNGEKPLSDAQKSQFLIFYLKIPLAYYGLSQSFLALFGFRLLLQKVVNDQDYYGSLKFVLGILYFPLVFSLQAWGLSYFLGNFTGIYYLSLLVGLISWLDYSKGRSD